MAVITKAAWEALVVVLVLITRRRARLERVQGKAPTHLGLHRSKPIVQAAAVARLGLRQVMAALQAERVALMAGLAVWERLQALWLVPRLAARVVLMAVVTVVR